MSIMGYGESEHQHNINLPLQQIRTTMAPLGLLAAAFVINGHFHSHSSTLHSSPHLEIEETGDLSRLCGLLGASPVDLLSLRTNQEGIRGVYLKKAVSKNDAILEIPLDSCLRDDSPPSWLQQSPSAADDDRGDAYSVAVADWVTRLTASLLDVQLADEKSEAVQTWLDLLPTNLRQILPIHWDSASLASAKCRALEMAVDSAYFARAGPVGELMASLSDSDRPALAQLQSQAVEDALDLVQTRSCRVEASDGRPYMRVLAPIFDLINHNRNHNAEFSREGENMVVRAIRDIDAEREVFINYGGSTHPAWGCLFSYGFVPLSEDVYGDDETELVVYDDDKAEMVLDGKGFEVGPNEIPFELVQHVADNLGQHTASDGKELELTTEIGRSIVCRIIDAARELETSPNKQAENNDAASQLAADLRESSRRTLLACADGLKEYVEEL